MRILIGLVVLALAVPASATLLTNGGFENPQGPEWVSSAGLKWGFVPSHTPTPLNKDGTKHVGMDVGGGSFNITCYQTVNYAGPITFIGYAHAGPGSGGCTNKATITVYDGGVGGTVLGSGFATGPSGIPGDNWTPVSVTGTATSGQVTVQFRVEGNSDWSTPAAARVDAFTLTPEPASLAMLVLAGLPLLRRRR